MAGLPAGGGEVGWRGSPMIPREVTPLRADIPVFVIEHTRTGLIGPKFGAAGSQGASGCNSFMLHESRGPKRPDRRWTALGNFDRLRFNGFRVP